MSPALVAVLSTAVVLATAAPVVRRAMVRSPATPPRLATPSGELDLVDVGEQIAREARAGAGIHASITAALLRSPSLAPEVTAALARSAPLSDALAAHRPRHDERDLLVHALRIGADHTHVLPSVVERTVLVVRERRAWQLERVAQAAQARTSARVLTVLPMAFAGWGALSSPSVREAYATSPVTATVAAVGVALNLVGWWWMRRVVGSGR